MKIGGRGELVCRCLGCGAGWREFVEYVGLPASDWFLQPLAARPHARGLVVQSKPVAEYPYHDRRGELVAVKVRWEPAFDGRRKKDFTWRRPVPAADRTRVGIPPDAFAWAKGLEAGWYEPAVGRDGTYWFSPAGKGGPRTDRGVELPRVEVGPYREHEVEAADPKRVVFVVEGEGKADLLAAAGILATSGPAGKGVWKAEWGQMFNGRRVYAVPDPDGVEWACRVLASAVGWGAQALSLVSLPQEVLARGEDIKDWLTGYEPAAVRESLSWLVNRSTANYTRG